MHLPQRCAPPPQFAPHGTKISALRRVGGCLANGGHCSALRLLLVIQNLCTRVSERAKRESIERSALAPWPESARAAGAVAVSLCPATYLKHPVWL